MWAHIGLRGSAKRFDREVSWRPNCRSRTAAQIYTWLAQRCAKPACQPSASRWRAFKRTSVITTAPHDARSGYRPDIDGLRALAVTSVVLFHAAPGLLPSGFVGVDVFFVISGFLIGGIIFRRARAGSFSFADFYARRARRILPALLAVVAACLVAGFFVLSAGELSDLATSAMGALSGLVNFKFWLRSDYFAPDASFSPLLMTWSLAVEEQFYVLFPLLMLAVVPRGRRATIAALALVAVISFGASLILTRTHPSFAFYLLPTRAWELAAGALLALAMDQARKPLPSKWREAFALTGLSLVFASFIALAEAPFPGSAAALPVAGSVLLIAAQGSWINRQILSPAPVVFVGLVSYSWYLWHWPMMAFVRLASPAPPSDLTMLAVAAVSFAVAVASWRFVETPFRAMGAAPWATLARYGVVLACILAIPTAFKLTEGAPARLPEEAAVVRATVKAGRGDCLAPFGSSHPEMSDHCQPRGDGPAVALIGDSHASALGPGLRRHGATDGYRLLQLTKSACVPLLGVEQRDERHPRHADECKAFVGEAVNIAASDPDVKTVILAASWPLIENRYYLSPQTSDEGISGSEALAKGLSPVVAALTAAGKTVILVGDVPAFQFDPRAQILAETIPARGAIARLASPVYISSDRARGAEVAPPNATSEAALLNLTKSFDKVSYVDARRVFCAAEACKFREGAKLLFIDAHHLSTVGSNLIPWPEGLAGDLARSASD